MFVIYRKAPASFRWSSANSTNSTLSLQEFVIFLQCYVVGLSKPLISEGGLSALGITAPSLLSTREGRAAPFTGSCHPENHDREGIHPMSMPKEASVIACPVLFFTTRIPIVPGWTL